MADHSKVVPESEYTKEYFLNACAGYDRFTEDGFKLGGALKRCYDRAAITKTDRVLDIGCGRGELLFSAKKEGAEVYGTDYATAAIEIIQSTIAKIGATDIHVAQAGLPDLHFNSQSFTKIFFLDVVEHIPESVVLETLDQIAKQTAKNGTLIVHTDNYFFQKITMPCFRFFRKHLLRQPIIISDHEKLHINFQSLPGLAKKIRNRGFRLEFADYIYPQSPSDLIHWTSIRNPTGLRVLYALLRLTLATPAAHLICPTFDIKAVKE